MDSAFEGDCEGVEGGLPAGRRSLLASTRRVEAADGEVEAFHRCLLGREVTTRSHTTAQSRVHALDRVGAVQDLADLRAVGKERHKLRPSVFPQPDDRGVALAPLAGELV